MHKVLGCDYGCGELLELKSGPMHKVLGCDYD